jgi:tRNA(Arg) A34 adenosine deaminase TadA
VRDSVRDPAATLAEHDDQRWMRRAIELARDSVRRGGGPFGAVIVRGGALVAEGSNQVTLESDPTAHAEIVAIRAACRAVGDFSLNGCTIYSSCEPCPMCLGSIYWARLERLVFACTRQDAARAGFDDELIYRELSLAPDLRRLPTTQLLRDEALSAFQDWSIAPDRREY